MALEVGGIYTTAGVRVDGGSFREYRRRMDAARSDARRPIEGEAKLDVDRRGFRELERHQDSAERKTKRFSSGIRASMGAVRVGVAGAAAAGGAAVGAFAINVINSASDINESLTKNDTLFGSHAKGIDRWSKQTASSLGISRKAALEYTGTFGNLFRALEIGPGKSAALSKSLTELAADMASFNNSSPEEALEALRSGLVGETEPLRRFGVNMNDATLKQEALRQGLIKDTKETLPSQAKALAAVALITKQTSAAHGDFAKTSGGLANQQRILKARLSDAGSELGARLLPAALKVVKGLNSLVGAGDGAAGIFRKVRDVAGDVIRWFRNDKGFQEYGARARRIFELVKDTVVDTFARVKRVFAGSGGDFRAFAQGIAAVANRIGEALEPVAERVIPAVGDAVEALARTIRGMVRIIGGLFTGDWKRAWRGAKDVAKGALDGIVAVLRATGIDRLLQSIINRVVGLVNGVIGVINKLPGVNIGKVQAPNIVAHGDGSGGNLSSSTIDRRTRGYYAGGIVDAPIAIVGEEAPEHPEVIIPSNPRYRGRAVELWQEAGRMIGIPGFKTGGVLRRVAGAVGDVAEGAVGLAGKGYNALKGMLPDNPLPAPFDGLGSYVLGKARDFIGDKAKALLDAAKSAVGVGGRAGGYSTTGLLPQVLRALAWARSHGWGGTVTSGFRSRAQQQALWDNRFSNPYPVAPPGTSNHEGGRAVDVTDPAGFRAAMASAPANARLIWYGPGDAVHFSIDGHRRGGIAALGARGMRLPAGALAGIPGFASGGKRGKRKAPKPILSSADNRGIARSLRRGDRGISRFEGRIADLERTYGQRDREYGLTDEDFLIENDDGSITVNDAAVAARGSELTELRKIRQRIADTIKRYREAVEAMIARYRAAIAQLEQAMAAAKGKARKKERAGYREQIGRYRTRIGELKDVGHDLGFDAEDARLDLAELDSEIATVKGTTGQAAPADSSSGSDLGDGGAGSSSSDPDSAAIAAQANARADALAADLAAVRGNLAAFTSSGDLGTGLGSSAYGSALADARYASGPGMAGVVAGDAGLAGGITIEVHSFAPPTGAQAIELGDAVVDALRARPARPVTQATVGG